MHSVQLILTACLCAQTPRMVLAMTPRSAPQCYPRLEVLRIVHCFAHGFVGVTSPTIATSMTPNRNQHCRLGSSILEIPIQMPCVSTVRRNMTVKYVALSHCWGCWKTSPQRYHVMRLVGESSWQESDQSDNFDRRSKFLEISSTTYIENKQYTEF